MTGRRGAAALGVALAAAWLLWPAGGQPGLGSLTVAVLLVRELAGDLEVRLFVTGDTSLLLTGTRSLMGYLVLLGWGVEVLLAVVLVVLAGVLRDVRPPPWTEVLPLLPLALAVALIGPGVVLDLFEGEKRYGGALIVSQPIPVAATQARVTALVLLLVPPVLAVAAELRRRRRTG